MCSSSSHRDGGLSILCLDDLEPNLTRMSPSPPVVCSYCSFLLAFSASALLEQTSNKQEVAVEHDAGAVC